MTEQELIADCWGKNRLVLGTAQLGMPYAIANKTGQPDAHQAFTIVKTAWDNGIHEFDTAQAYGESECILGAALAELGVSQQAKIITKIDPQIELENECELRRSVEKSLNYLRVNRLFGLMIHREENINLTSQKLRSAVRDLIRDGLSSHIGISVYTPVMAIQAIETDFFDMLQMPANILDRRFYEAGILELARKKQKQLYIRSIFLQGLLLMEPHQIPVEMRFAQSLLASFTSLSEEIGRSRQEIALTYVKSRYPDARIIFGAETPLQVLENVRAWPNHLSIFWVNRLEEKLSPVDESVVDPRLWSKLTVKG
ncbi:MAG: aldo/keto reductase [Syntrophales bacterium]|jgi:aryl-alcohol dehydrogenase-like predicted oxidoreductase